MVEVCSNEAILIFDNDDIVKEITYAEFQAVLDNYVPLHDVALKSMKAVYVSIDRMLHVTVAVFFTISFDQQGFVERSWNLPLQRLAESTTKGPDMGSGEISLCCYSHCPIECYKHCLWDPEWKPPNNHFDKIKKSIKNNSLWVVFSARNEVFSKDFPFELSNASTQSLTSIDRQKLKHELFNAEAKQSQHQLILDYEERILAYQQQLNEQVAINIALEEKVLGQAEKIQGLREYLQSKLQVSQRTLDNELKALRDHYESELLLQVESAVAAYEAQLKSRDFELLYSSEREQKLQQEVLSLQGINKQLLNDNGKEILDRLHDMGVNFVVYHFGVGHLTIQVANINQYIENPLAYAAAQCGISEHLYRAWLDHYFMPTCQHTAENGKMCDILVDQVDNPSQFIIGESDRCPNHRTQTSSAIRFRESGR